MEYFRLLIYISHYSHPVKMFLIVFIFLHDERILCCNFVVYVHNLEAGTSTSVGKVN